MCFLVSVYFILFCFIVVGPDRYNHCHWLTSSVFVLWNPNRSQTDYIIVPPPLTHVLLQWQCGLRQIDWLVDLWPTNATCCVRCNIFSPRVHRLRTDNLNVHSCPVPPALRHLPQHLSLTLTGDVWVVLVLTGTSSGLEAELSRRSRLWTRLLRVTGSEPQQSKLFESVFFFSPLLLPWAVSAVCLGRAGQQHWHETSNDHFNGIKGFGWV